MIHPTLILTRVAAYFISTPAELIGKPRQSHIARARMVCMWMMRRHTEMSLAEIGAFLGNRDHTTILHGVRTVERNLKTDEQLSKQLDFLNEYFAATEAVLQI